ncbi:MAG: hypothetical protein AAB443_03410 [Patescibacteria group bacterium]
MKKIEVESFKKGDLAMKVCSCDCHDGDELCKRCDEGHCTFVEVKEEPRPQVKKVRVPINTVCPDCGWPTTLVKFGTKRYCSTHKVLLPAFCEQLVYA